MKGRDISPGSSAYCVGRSFGGGPYLGGDPCAGCVPKGLNADDSYSYGGFIGTQENVRWNAVGGEGRSTDIGEGEKARLTRGKPHVGSIQEKERLGVYPFDGAYIVLRESTAETYVDPRYVPLAKEFRTEEARGVVSHNFVAYAPDQCPSRHFPPSISGRTYRPATL